MRSKKGDTMEQPYAKEYGYSGLFTEEHKQQVLQHYPRHGVDTTHAEVVITAGGTQEPIDDVRYVGNFSSGRFGHALAHEYSQQGCHVTLLAPTSVVERFGLARNISHVPFGSAESLRNAMLSFEAADLILHAAAVADYTPKKVTGKISSDQDHLTIDMERTPKILSLLRDHFGNATTIVGFKLLSGVSVEKLTDVATKQIADNNTNYSVANLLEGINGSKGEREVHLVKKDGTSQVFSGPTPSVARGVYSAIRWTSRSKAFYA
jgi:phosphopantothenoylcysteine decarboxylase/phosphopantothenate--cysteine ligase